MSERERERERIIITSTITIANTTITTATTTTTTTTIIRGEPAGGRSGPAFRPSPRGRDGGAQRRL